ncbi:hypothetical protein J2T17_005008 [Paenibacillus mucilaginosus]|uniref:hypothetical protein n=1 Tax=Paenibacillus mucilaginosus TaxID=61624 RepID=UPI003D23D62D
MKKSSKVAIVTLAAVFTVGFGIFATSTLANDASMGQKRKLSKAELEDLKHTTGVYHIKDVGSFERTTEQLDLDLPKDEIAYSFDDATVKTKMVIDKEYAGTFVRVEE